MVSRSHIEWTETTWNPVTGCSKVSAGCKNCYAERMAKRLKAMRNRRYINGFEVTMHPDLFDEPKKWKKPRLIFVNSMSDLFHEAVSDEVIARIFETMNACPQHTFQILTKRSERLREMASKLCWSDNIWMGVSVEDSKVYHRISDLAYVPSKVRFLSCEPLIGPVESLPLENVDWVIVGGESGPRSRPIEKDWVRSVRDQCTKSNTAFFFKQWGGVRKDLTGKMLDGKTHVEMPKIDYLSKL